MMQKTKIAVLTFVILLITRVWQVIMQIFYYQTPFWKSVKNDNFEHYQYAVPLLLLSLILRSKINEKLYILLISFSSAMLIDEMYQLFSFFWRTSFYFLSLLDWVLLFLGYAGFVLLIYSKKKIEIILTFWGLLSFLVLLFSR
jgi:hypothetical protein